MLRFLVIATVMGCGEAVTPSLEENDVVEVTAVATTNDQEGAPGLPLPSPLQVRLLKNGRPQSGVRVWWTAESGTMAPPESRTDADGLASAVWVLAENTTNPTATATVDVPGMPAVPFRARPRDDARVTVSALSSGQRAQVGAPLGTPLQILVTYRGRPSVGARVYWSANGGTITEQSLTDSAGIALASWTLPRQSGVYQAFVRLQNLEGPAAAILLATAVPGPVVSVRALSGQGQSLPSNFQKFTQLGVLATDAYDNPVPGSPVAWRVESGPLTLTRADSATDARGYATADVRPAGSEGAGIVSATSGGGPRATFSLTATSPLGLILLETNDDYRFRSAVNNTTPAVDTVKVGSEVTWRLSPFDYDSHDVTIVDGPARPAGGTFPYASPSEVRITFTVPGTYRYVDSVYGGSGTLVVRP